MFRHYLITTLRHFARHKLYSFINIAGLSVGIACAIFILLFVHDELSFDKWIPGSSNLYRVEVTFNIQGAAPIRAAQTLIPLPRVMKEQIPEITAMTRLVPEPETVRVGTQRFAQPIAFVDPNFFDVIKLPLVAGDAATALARPESAVLSESAARKFFGDVDPIGKTLTISGSGILCDPQDQACLTAVHPVTVTAVMKDLPHNTHLDADVILPNTSQADELPAAWREQQWTGTNGSYGYVTLAPGADPETVLAKLPPVLDRSIDAGSMRGSELVEVSLTPFSDVHLTSDNYGAMKPPGSWTIVSGLVLIALLIVLLACFNFMNLATARATLRAREISLRKTVGAHRLQLIVQFLGEALLMAVASLALALGIVEILLPAYNAFLNRPISFLTLTEWPMLAGLLGGTILIGLLSGLYPAFILSSFRPAVGLRTSKAGQSGSGWLRTALVIAQFAVSIALGIAATVVFSQIRFAHRVDLGFDRSGVVIMRGVSKLGPSARESLSRALKAHPGITAVGLSDAVPFDLFNASNIPVRVQGNPQDVAAHIINIDPEFQSLYGMRLLAGRLLSTEHGEDIFSSGPFSGGQEASGRNVLINEAAARRFGYTAQAAVGKTIVANGSQVTIAGVTADLKLDGLKESVIPSIYAYYPGRYTFLSIRVQASGLSESLSFIDDTWRSFAPDSAIQRAFLSDTFEKLFRADEEQAALFGLFVFIAVFIACLGLFGLAAFTAERRTKEIGVRKVFGAHTVQILRLLLWQFSVPVLIANVIAWPLAFYYLHNWLETYAYRIFLSPLYFLAAGASALAIAWLTVLVHAMRIARSSPVNSLRYE